MRRFLFFGVIVPLLLGFASAQAESGASRKYRFLEWNVENLFDTIPDEGFRDEEFLPHGERHWTSFRYWQKLTEIAKVIAAVADDGGFPDLIGLCEVENDSVLTTLTERSILRTMGYHYVMTESEDERGIDCGLLYFPDRFRLLEHRGIRVPSRKHGYRATRDILYAKGLILCAENRLDTLHVLVAHLPSRAGGQEGERNRMLAAETLWSVVDSLQTNTSSVLVMGDFNAGRNDRVFKRCPLRVADDPKDPGTYCYQGIWQWLDHILVSPSLAGNSVAHSVRLPWLLEENKTYGVDMPRRTYRGPAYHGGISDHLPLVMDLYLNTK